MNHGVCFRTGIVCAMDVNPAQLFVQGGIPKSQGGLRFGLKPTQQSARIVPQPLV